MSELIARFCRAYGTPNDIRLPEPELDLRALVADCMHGQKRAFAYDLENANYILSFSFPLLEANASPVRMLRLYGYLRQERPGPRAKIVQAESRFSLSAAKADEWVPIRPGTEGALALGIAYVLLREGMYDRSFVDAHTFGFDDWVDAAGVPHLGFRSLVLRDYNLDAVARITGVPVATVLRIAKEFGTRRPAVALGLPTSTNALYSAMAIHALNALVGSIDTPGGVVFPRTLPLQRLPEVELDAAAHASLALPRLDRTPQREAPPLAENVPAFLPEAIRRGQPYPAGALFLYYANPAFSFPQPQLFARALEKVPLVVSFSPYVDESTLLADFVLPDHTPLERWEDVPAPPVTPYPMLAVRQPVVEPLYNTMHAGDVLLRLARAVGGAPAAAMSWNSFLDLLRESVRGLYEARRGSIAEPFHRTPWVALLEERGWWLPAASSFEEFWELLLDKGGWWDPVYSFGEWDRVFRTRSRKFEFYSLRLREVLADPGGGSGGGTGATAGGTPELDLACMPHFESPQATEPLERYPFHLILVRSLALPSGRNANQPFLQEILEPRLRVRWDSWVEIHPHSAELLGIGDGDLVWVESPVGKVRARARLSSATMPDVVNMPVNLGHMAHGRWARGIGVNAMELLTGRHDTLSGLPAPGATRVRVYRA